MSVCVQVRESLQFQFLVEMTKDHTQVQWKFSEMLE